MIPDIPYSRPSPDYVYNEIDRPYIQTLVEMETTGVRIDVDHIIEKADGETSGIFHSLPIYVMVVIYEVN